MAEENSRTPGKETTLERADRNYGELLQELTDQETDVVVDDGVGAAPWRR
ncbi:hypothetical protein ACFY94_14605 [Streptomyces griseorubiginosus]